MNLLDEEFDPPLIQASADALVYFRGSINLKPFNSLNNEDFQRDYEINFLGAVKAINAFYLSMPKSANGSIVMFSTVAEKVGIPYHASIASDKAAIEGLPRSLAAEFAPHIRVNCIAPSLTDTPMTSKLISTGDRKNSVVQRNALKQIGNPEDLAAMAEFLIGEKSTWITGQVNGVDGGMSTLNLVQPCRSSVINRFNTPW